ncbi:hypothetical protein MPH_11520 [Macrophomina phaseolina MS6]|uniref:O-methyltransferase family 2 n=1 Tax=Macrophomina phaseolina (strain MS6) TaxID=1126212 RepID=K2RME2_MACPH|nr:hypothetical protein MPH_11520 [Macrophomina phaseolina MS6]
MSLSYTEKGGLNDLLVTHCQDNSGPARDGTSQPLVSPEDPSGVISAKQSILAAISRIQTLLSGPVDFVQQLASQSQLLACMQWFGDFQVLACIPLSGSVPLRDVSELAGVPESQLSRIVRMTATAGFLREPQPGHVAHTALSAQFVLKPSYLDAAMFLAGTAVPAALKMPIATQRFGHSCETNESAYNLAFNTSTTFSSSCEQRKKLQRQWSAYLRYVADQWDDGVGHILKSFDPLRLANASVVEVGATSTEGAAALLNLNSTLRIVMQISPRKASTNGSSAFDERCLLDPRVSMQQRLPGTPQTVRDASVYILHLPSALSNTPSNARAARIAAEISAHVDVLRANTSAALLIPTTHLVPNPGAVEPGVESTARQRDLTVLQLFNCCEMEMSEFTTMLNGTSDSLGRLVVVNKLRSSNGAPVALELRYRLYTG